MHFVGADHKLVEEVLLHAISRRVRVAIADDEDHPKVDHVEEDLPEDGVHLDLLDPLFSGSLQCLWIRRLVWQLALLRRHGTWGNLRYGATGGIWRRRRECVRERDREWGRWGEKRLSNIIIIAKLRFDKDKPLAITFLLCTMVYFTGTWRFTSTQIFQVLSHVHLVTTPSLYIYVLLFAYFSL